jgi:thioredoxin reductase (NADPH)
MSKQSERYCVTLENDEVSGLLREGDGWKVAVYQDAYLAKAVIYAAGSLSRFLGVRGEKELLGRGVSICATCDAPFFIKKKVAVLGGGDTALSEALHLSKFAAAVYLIHRRDQFRAEKILQDRVFRNDKIKIIWDAEVIGFNGEQRLESLEIRHKKSPGIETVAFDGAFLAIGTIPNTGLLKDLVKLDDNGYIETDISLRTEAKGLFVAGEVIKGNRRQVAISVGMGVQASLNCEEYLASLD